MLKGKGKSPWGRREKTSTGTIVFPIGLFLLAFPTRSSIPPYRRCHLPHITATRATQLLTQPRKHPSTVLIRIVRMTFRPDALAAFMAIFDASAPKIRAFPGCLHLELWQDDDDPHILTTHSHWTDSAALDRYRQSDVFKQTWAKTKPLFAAPPLAFSNHALRSAEEIAQKTKPRAF